MSFNNVFNITQRIDPSQIERHEMVICQMTQGTNGRKRALLALYKGKFRIIGK